MKILTPIGPLWLNANAQALTHISYLSTVENPEANQHILHQAAQELQEFLAGKRTTFAVPYVFAHGTTFQKQVWQALTEIPYGDTCSYQALAKKIHRPKAVRAIGQANRRNPLPILVPCHRVIGKNGQLTGYAGSDPVFLSIKDYLLTLEKTP